MNFNFKLKIVILGLKKTKRILVSFYRIIFASFINSIDCNGVVKSDRAKVLYIPIAKNGCSSIKKLIYEYESRKSIGSDHELHKIVNSNESIFSESLTVEHQGYQKLFVCRNPFLRTISFYRNKFEEYNKPRGSGRPEFAYSEYLNGVFRSSMKFEEVVDVLSQIPDSLSERHFQSQSFGFDYYLKKNDNDITIIALEDRDKLNEFCRGYFGKLMYTTNSTSTDDGEIDLIKKYYTIETLNNIYERYKSDVNRFGYKSDYDRYKEVLVR
ncbi:sulfotransferase family protein [Vibrio sp. JPW-9-11-11]|uniref:sulfotransferase family 2 domain-containing protein n=1 Tax=Vibrio sp. JPW-9-11-11 TaxID=1416532 RepID=UPI001594217E|nr:sulfotransferase family 2 domain-containing protein [Vibrio sp. JPW-9-11-11]NVD05385.1 sulfotransferase family protein [Vibrio sp. JPW-9-11-11]